MRLSQLTTGESGVIIKILGHGAFRKRMIEMGFVRGHEIKVLMAAPLRDPVKYEIMGYEVSLRHSEADLVEVEPLPSTIPPERFAHTNTVTESSSADNIPTSSNVNAERHRVINVALIGNPNCGKTSLFNIASGAREHVGNYSGVTVDAKYGEFTHNGYHFNIVDLPGTYSLASYSPEELYVRRYLRNEAPDVIINVVDGIKLAYQLTCSIPELQQELRTMLEIMEPELLSPAIRAVRRNTLKAMKAKK